MNEEQLIATLQACYFGDKGAFNKILKEYKQLQQELTKYKERNEKAIEYIKYEEFGEEYGHFIVPIGEDNGCPYEACEELLEILEDKGE